MAKKIICAITALIFITSMLVFPTSAEVTVVTAPTCTEPGVSIRNGETINVAPLGHDWGGITITNTYPNGLAAPYNTTLVDYEHTCQRCGVTETVTGSEFEVTNFSFNIKKAFPEAVVKDGVIGEGEYQRVYIPEQEVIIGNAAQLINGDNEARSQAIKDSAKLYMSWDEEHGVNIAVEYISPEISQTADPTYYHGNPHPQADDPSWFYSGDQWIGPQDGFMNQTAFIIDGYDSGSKTFYYAVSKSTLPEGKYLKGHWFGSDSVGSQYGYDENYWLSDDDVAIVYDFTNNHVVMEWSIPLEVLTGVRADSGNVNGLKYGFNITLTQGSSSASTDLSETSVVKFGSLGAFENKGATPKRKKKTFTNPIMGELNPKTINNGNLPMVATFVDDGTYIGPIPESSEVEVEPDLYASLTLKDSIDVNFYVDGVTAEMANSYTFKYSTDGENYTSIPFSEGRLAEDDEDKYIFTPVTFNANQFTKPVYFKVFNGNG
ncbi:MAG: hypothetical protein IKG80_06780, partial [Clostridia bacterium]|nr:hypothetical protein [Clostridia bacterium]